MDKLTMMAAQLNRRPGETIYKRKVRLAAELLEKKKELLAKIKKIDSILSQ